jgi:hypothetical protein
MNPGILPALSLLQDKGAHPVERTVMSTKHPKTKVPSDVDLYRNPLIGGSKGVTMGQATLDDLEDIGGENTIEGDVANDTNPQGGIEQPHRRRGRPSHERTPKPRHRELQGKKTHEQQLRTLERKPDVPDARQVEAEMSHIREEAGAKLPRRDARQSDSAVSRGGLNQESQHNKHNDPGQHGHKPQKNRA